MSIMYGRLTAEELAQQGDDPYVANGNKRYRITELVRRHDGGANYQAKEVTESDPEPAEPTMPEPTVLEGVENGASVRYEYKDPPAPEPPPFKPIAPPLHIWARSNGWSGKARIPRAVREKYRETFGVEE